VKWSGFVVAGIGFFLTRFTVTLALHDSPVQFAFAGLIPLAAGLLLTSFGVALAVSDRDRRYVRTVAKWCVISVVAMSVLVATTLLAEAQDPMSMVTVRSSTPMANFLIGGAIGGVILGMRTADSDQQRGALRRQTTRLVTLNRILRHEVLNATAVILGHVSHLVERDDNEVDDDTLSTIHRRGKHIQDTIDDVKYLTEANGRVDSTLDSVELDSLLDARIETLRQRYPNATFDVEFESADSRPAVLANAMLGSVFDHLLENAVEHNDGSPRVDVDVTETAQSVVVTVRDDGPGLPDRQRRLLERRDVTKYDDPNSGFGLSVVGLLVDQYGGEVTADVGDDGTAISVELLRADADVTRVGTERDYYGMSPGRLATAVTASLVAGVLMGVVLQYGAGILPVIGSLYGVQNALVGWISHIFHSVVFGMVYASLLEHLEDRVADGTSGAVLLGVGYGFLLWLVAARLVMPLWLRLVDVPLPGPNVALVSLVGHLLWGMAFGVLFEVLCDRELSLG
jgi:signal transduction histidine kinase